MRNTFGSVDVIYEIAFVDSLMIKRTLIKLVNSHLGWERKGTVVNLHH